MRTLVRLAAMCAAAFVALSFVLFAVDQSEEGSANQVRTVNGVPDRAESEASIDRPAPDRATERIREARHGGVRELIDDGNDVVVAPFVGVASSSNVWVERLVAGGLAGLVFGLGGVLLANFVPRSRRKATDWREATG
ncbi:MAG: hypothetical protein M3217_00025 [Actinomycetota bacterium]|nr:hypothetical protein [Actinomycetota bacterium]